MAHSNSTMIKESITSFKDIRPDISQTVECTINENSFFLVAQPIVSSDKKIKFHEILARIFISNENIMYPDSFLPIARTLGLLPSLDRAIIKQTIKFLYKSFNKSSFSINLNPETLIDVNFVKFVKDLFETYKIDSSRIIFEIVESDIIDQKNICNVISELRSTGIKIAIDDFGTGHSNYSRLKWLNVDILKIDGSFIRDVIINDFDKKAVQSFIEIAKLKNSKVVAEFVENKETMDYLISQGIDFFQGYHVGRPIELDKL